LWFSAKRMRETMYMKGVGQKVSGVNSKRQSLALPSFDSFTLHSAVFFFILLAQKKSQGVRAF
jgi:hypothetical protein